MSGLVVGIVDPSSLVARDVRDLLRTRAFPSSRTRLFHTGDPASGLLTDDGGEAAFVSPAEPGCLDGCHVAFLCGTAGATARFLAVRGQDGCTAIDLSGVRSGGTWAPPPGPAREPVAPAPLYLLRNPAAVVLSEAVAAVDAVAPVTGVTVAVDRPASELGKAGVDELFEQAVALASFRSLPKDVHGAQAAFSLFSPADAAEYEAALAGDFEALTSGRFPLGVLSLRAGVFHGTTLRVELRFRDAAPAASAVREALLGRSDRFADADVDGPAGLVDAAGRDETIVLRVDSSGTSARLVLAADHLRGPGATLAVSLAERIVADGGLLADA